MAYIQFTDNDEIEHLHSPHLFGRNNPAANSSLNNDLISRKHASIEWHKNRWVLLDLSRNGSWVNGKQVKQHTAVELKVGDIVKLGNNNTEAPTFKVCQLDKPQNLVYRPHPSLETIVIGNSNLIPNPTTPDFGLYYCNDRKNWFSEQFNIDVSANEYSEQGPHKHGCEIQCSGNRWKLFILNGIDEKKSPNTTPNRHIDEVEFRIAYNRKNDNTIVSLVNKETEIELKKQPYNQLLAHLINLQQVSSDGWVSLNELSNTTKKSIANINLNLFLFKHEISLQLKDHQGISKIINRKPGSIQLGVNNYSIFRNGKLDRSSDLPN